jgi:hypothetical protein
LLSFPLYYLDTADARDFLKFVMTEKFRSTVGIPPQQIEMAADLKAFPNPVKDAVNVTFTMDQPGRVRLKLVSMQGQTAAIWIDSRLGQGTFSYRFSTASLSPGLYHIVLQNEKNILSRKIIRIN